MMFPTLGQWCLIFLIAAVFLYFLVRAVENAILDDEDDDDEIPY